MRTVSKKKLKKKNELFFTPTNLSQGEVADVLKNILTSLGTFVRAYVCEIRINPAETGRVMKLKKIFERGYFLSG